jgi:hypothetical protein
MTGIYLCKPTSIVSTGAGNSSSISANGSVTFTTCATISLNGVFSSDYDNYQVIMRHTGSTSVTFRLRFRVSGSDDSTTNYFAQILESYSTTTSTVRNSSVSEISLGSTAAIQSGGHTFWVYGPFLRQQTALFSISGAPWSASFPNYLIDNAALHAVSNSYDGFSLYPGSGTISGSLAVYGLVK